MSPPTSVRGRAWLQLWNLCKTRPSGVTCSIGTQDAGECVHARRISSVVVFWGFFFDQCPLLLHSLVLPLKLTLSSQTLKAQLHRRYLLFFFPAKKTRNSDFREQSSISRSAARPFDVKKEYYLVPKYNLHPPCGGGSVSI